MTQLAAPQVDPYLKAAIDAARAEQEAQRLESATAKNSYLYQAVSNQSAAQLPLRGDLRPEREGPMVEHAPIVGAAKGLLLRLPLGLAEDTAEGVGNIADALVGLSVGNRASLAGDPFATNIEKIDAAIQGVVDPVLHYGVSRPAHGLAGWLRSLRETEAIAPDHRALIDDEGAPLKQQVLNRVNNIHWWTDSFAENAGSAVATLLPGMAASKMGRAAGMTKLAARQFGFDVAAGLLFFQEAGGDTQTMIDDLVERGIAEGDARTIVARGKVAYGFASAMVEAGILPTQFTTAGAARSGVMGWFLRVMAGGTGEVAEEEAQYLLEGVTRLLIAEQADPSMAGSFYIPVAGEFGLHIPTVEGGVTPIGALERAAGAFAGGGAFGGATRSEPMLVEIRNRRKLETQAIRDVDRAFTGLDIKVQRYDLQQSQAALQALNAFDPDATRRIARAQTLEFDVRADVVEVRSQVSDELAGRGADELAEAALFAQQMLAQGIDPQSEQPLDDDQRIKLRAILSHLGSVPTGVDLLAPPAEALIGTPRRRNLALEQSADGQEVQPQIPASDPVQSEAGAGIVTEQPGAVTDATGRGGSEAGESVAKSAGAETRPNQEAQGTAVLRDEDRGERPAQPAAAAESAATSAEQFELAGENPYRLPDAPRRITLKSLEQGLLEAGSLYGLDPVEQSEIMLGNARGGGVSGQEDGPMEQYLPDEDIKPSEDYLTDLSPGLRRQIQNRLGIGYEQETIRDFLGDRLYDAALEVKVRGKAALKEYISQQIIDGANLYNPEDVLNAMLWELRRMNLPELGLTKTKFEFLDAPNLPVGAAWTAFGEYFEVMDVDGTRCAVCEAFPDRGVPVEFITRFPADPGTFTILPDDQRGENVTTEDPLDLGEDIIPAEADLDDADRAGGEPAAPSESLRSFAGQQLGLLGEQFAGGITGGQATIPFFEESQLAEETKGKVSGGDDVEGQLTLGGTNVGQRLALAEKYFTERMKQRQTPLAQAIKRAPESVRPRLARGHARMRAGGSLGMLHLIDLAAALSARAIKAGVNTSAKLADFVHQSLKEKGVTAATRKREKKVYSLTKKYHAAARRRDPKTKTIRLDLDRYERAVHDDRRREADRMRRQDMTVKEIIHRAVVGPVVMIPQQEVWRAVMKAQDRGERRVVSVQAKLDKLRMQTQQRAMEVDAIKAALVQIIQTTSWTETPAAGSTAKPRRRGIPMEVRGRMLKSVQTIKTYRGLARAINKLNEQLEKFRTREAHGQLRSLIRRVTRMRLRPDFQAEVDRLVGPIDAAKISSRKRAKLEQLEKYLSHPDSDAILTPRLAKQIARLAKTPVKDLSRQEAEDIINAIRHFLLLNSQWNQARIEGRKLAVTSLADDINGELLSVLKPRRTDSLGRVVGKTTRISTLPFHKEIRYKPETMAEFMGGVRGVNSASYKALYAAPERAYDRALGRYLEGVDHLEQAIAATGIKLGGRELKDWSAAFAGEYSITRQIATLGKHRAGEAKVKHIVSFTTQAGDTLRMTKDERMYLLASLERPRTIDQIVNFKVPIHLKGRPAGENYTLTMQDVERLREQVGNEDIRELKIVAAVLEFLNGPAKDALRQWSVDRLGYDITEPDTYFPIRRGKIQAPEGFAASWGMATLKSASVVQDVVEVSHDPIEIGSIFVEYHNNLWTTFQVAELEPAIDLVRKVLANQKVAATINNSRPELRRYWEDWLQELAREAVGGNESIGFVGRMFRSATNLMTRGLLGLNPSTWTVQSIAITRAAEEIESHYLVAAMGSIGRKDVWKRMLTIPHLRARVEGSAYGLINEQSERAKNILGFHAKGDIFMRYLSWADARVIVRIFRAAELKIAKTRPHLSKAEQLAAAGELASTIVKRTQTGYDIFRASGLAVEATTSPLLKGATLFMSEANVNLNMMARAVMRAKRTRSPKSWARAVRTAANVIVLQALLYRANKLLWKYILNGFSLDEEDKEKFWQEEGFALIDAMASNWYFGGYLSALVRKLFAPRKPFEPTIPLAAQINDIGDGMRRMKEHWDDPRDKQFIQGVEEFITAGLALRGIPVAPIRMLFDFFYSDRGQEVLESAGIAPAGGSAPR